MPIIVGSRDIGHAHFYGKLFVRPLHCRNIRQEIGNYYPDLEILRSKRIGVTSLTFQGHVTSSVT